MAATPGYRAWLMIDGANGAGTNVSAYLDNLTFPQSTEMLEVTPFGSSSKRYIAGLNGGDQIGISGALETGFGTIMANAKAAQDAGTASFTAVYGPAGSVSGAPKITAEYLIASWEISTGVGGRAEFSGSLQIDGAVQNQTW